MNINCQLILTVIYYPKKVTSERDGIPVIDTKKCLFQVFSRHGSNGSIPGSSPTNVSIYLCKYLDHKGSAAMLVVKVVSRCRTNRDESEGFIACRQWRSMQVQGIHLALKPRVDSHQKSKTGVSVPPQKGTDVLQKIKRKVLIRNLGQFETDRSFQIKKSRSLYLNEKWKEEEGNGKEYGKNQDCMKVPKLWPNELKSEAKHTREAVVSVASITCVHSSPFWHQWGKIISLMKWSINDSPSRTCSARALTTLCY